MKKGSVFAEGPPDEVFYDEALVREAGLRMPSGIQLYLDYCRAVGITPQRRPVRREEIVAALKDLRAGS